tara:strand:- start:1135 stop:1593 length:459 start_codon:yes stop_codon:yes gene_type:complete
VAIKIILIILRWIFALPAGLITGFIVMFPVHWFLMFMYSIGGNPATLFISIETTERLIQGFVIPAVTIYVFAQIVPNLKKISTLILGSTIYIFILINWILLVFNNGFYCYSGNCIGPYSGLAWLEAPLQIGGLFFVIRYVYNYVVEKEKMKT